MRNALFNIRKAFKIILERTDFFITSNESEESNLDGIDAACQWNADGLESDSLTIKLGDW